MILEYLRRVVGKRNILSLFFAGSMVFSACIRQPPVLSNQTPLSEYPEEKAVVLETRIPLATDEVLETGIAVETTPPLPTDAFIENEQVILGFTNHSSDGNRWINGRGRLPEVEPLDIPLKGVPVWVVGAAMGEGSLWVVALEDGRIEAFHVIDRKVNEISIEPSSLEPGMPPMLRIHDGKPSLITVQDPEASSLTHPAILDHQGAMAYITREGDLVLWAEEEVGRLALSALPDSRILTNDAGDLLILNQSTDRYGHGVLGDTVEAAGMVLIETRPKIHIALEIPIQGSGVIEGIAPIWFDIDGDGEREIIVTISDAQQGAQLVVFDEKGQQVATSEPIGRGFRWRHQIAVAPSGPKGEMELVSVRTPHIGGVVEFHQLEEDELRLIVSKSGFSTHVIGSRNLDMAAAGDFDGDGRVEILIPDQSLSRLVGIRRIPGGVEESWSLPLNSTLNTNLAVATLWNLEVAVGVGTQDRFLRLWIP